jgi:hypothetical protein
MDTDVSQNISDTEYGSRLREDYNVSYRTRRTRT